VRPTQRCGVLLCGLVVLALECSLALVDEDLVTLADSSRQDPTDESSPPADDSDVGDEVAGREGPPPFPMMGTSGYFKLAAKDKVPKMYELAESLSLLETDEFVSLGEAANILRDVGAAADPRATVSRVALDKLIQRSTAKARVIAGEAHVIGAIHEGDHKGLELGESAALKETGDFQYTNGIYGANGGRQKWLKCESECKGSGFGGYGYCMTSGEGNPWGGCMAPGSDPGVERPPRLYTKNRITTSDQPRAHMFCDAANGGQVWIQSAGKLVAGCSSCVNDNYFMVPSHHVENMMVGSCFKIDQYEAWVKAVTSATTGAQFSLQCSIFTTERGMTSKYFGGKTKDEWDSAPRETPYHPRGFLCVTANKVHDNTVNGLLSKGYRQMRVFATTVARFVMCHTDEPEGGDMKCVKKTRVGKCKSFYVRNAAFDQASYHLPSPAANQTGLDWDSATSTWDDSALNLAATKLMEAADDSAVIGLHECDEGWTERMLATHQ